MVMRVQHNQSAKRHFTRSVAVHSVGRVTDVLAVPAPTAGETTRPGGGVWRVLASQTSVHSGAAVATTLFPLAGAAGVVSLRLVIGAALLVAVGRPGSGGTPAANGCSSASSARSSPA